MLDIRLISILGILAAIVVVALTLDYFRLIKRPARIGICIALLAVIAGTFLTLKAVLPDNNFYGQVYAEIKTNEKIVAITFDDGPYPPYTGQILDILKEYNIPATFFVIGKNVKKHPLLVRRIVEEGHQIGNHTYNHTDLLKIDRKEISAEIEKTNKEIFTACGETPVLIRPPHGFRDAVVMDVMAEKKLKVVEWSISTRDWSNPGVEHIVTGTVSKVKNGSVILLHDGDGIAQNDSRAQTVDATKEIIRQLLAKGYKFVTVSDILNKTEE